MSTYRPPLLKQPLVEPYLTHACDAWQAGGSLLLGLWAARRLDGWGVAAYARLVRQVRAELGDDTDYTQAEEVSSP